VNNVLDTNIWIYFLNRNMKIVEKLSTLPEESIALSCFNLAELLFGA
jgi:predicted nucleic acid-binding protein